MDPELSADPAGAAPRPPARPVDPRAVRWWTLRAVGEVLVLLAVESVGLGWGLDGDPGGWLVAALAVTVPLGAGYVAVMPRWRYRVHRWEAGEDAVQTLTGWLWQEWRVAPVSRVQTIDTAAGPAQRLLGLATVTVTTASSAGAVRIEGLDAGEAEALAGRLTALTQDHPGDAT